MSVESVLVNIVLFTATAAAVIKYVLFEWDGIAEAWHRVAARRQSRRSITLRENLKQ